MLVQCALVGSGVLFVATVGLWVARAIAKRSRTRRYRKMMLECRFTLPDEKNAYLRNRLQTALAVSEGEYSPPDLRFLQAKKMLYALAEKKLTAADGLIARKLRKDMGMYASKEYFTKNEPTKIAGTLSRLLTLCAKYGV